MFTAKYLIRINKNHFTENHADCLGSQLIEILNFLESLLPPHIWYGADIDAIFKDDKLIEFNSSILKKLGKISDLKKISKKVEQLLSGVFLAIKKEVSIYDNLLQLSTDDSKFRSLEIDGVFVEIRAFDTSYFELYCDDLELMKAISKYFNVEIQISLSIFS